MKREIEFFSYWRTHDIGNLWKTTLQKSKNKNLFSLLGVVEATGSHSKMENKMESKEKRSHWSSIIRREWTLDQLHRTKRIYELCSGFHIYRLLEHIHRRALLPFNAAAVHSFISLTKNTTQKPNTLRTNGSVRDFCCYIWVISSALSKAWPITQTTATHVVVRSFGTNRIDVLWQIWKYVDFWWHLSVMATKISLLSLFNVFFARTDYHTVKW